MGYVITFLDYQPAARADDVPWTGVRVEEAALATGPWTTIDTLELDPVDEDPAFPQRRDITTAEATSDRGWFRLVFTDDGTGLSPSEPIYTGPLPGGLTISELKRRMDHESDADDDLLRAFIASATEQAAAPWPDGCGRRLLSTPADPSDDPVEETLTVPSRVYRAGDGAPAAQTRLTVPDCREITTLTIDGSEVTDYTVQLRNGLIVQLTAEIDPSKRPNSVKLLGHFGYDEIPESMKDAIYTLAARKWYERAAQFADNVALAEGGQVQSYYRQLPPATRLIFSSFRLSDAYAGLS